MTSSEDFPDETLTPPAFVNTSSLAVGDIIAFNKADNELPLRITVRDDNIDDELHVRARLSVSGQPDQFHCPLPDTIGPSGIAQRESFPLNIEAAKFREGTCTMVEVFVSSRFHASDCATAPPNRFDLGRDEDDVATAKFWVWEMSRNPAGDGMAAIILVTSCPVLTRATTTQTTVR